MCFKASTVAAAVARACASLLISATPLLTRLFCGVGLGELPLVAQGGLRPDGPLQGPEVLLPSGGYIDAEHDNLFDAWERHLVRVLRERSWETLLIPEEGETPASRGEVLTPDRSDVPSDDLRRALIELSTPWRS